MYPYFFYWIVDNMFEKCKFSNIFLVKQLFYRNSLPLLFSYSFSFALYFHFLMHLRQGKINKFENEKRIFCLVWMISYLGFQYGYPAQELDNFILTTIYYFCVCVMCLCVCIFVFFWVFVVELNVFVCNKDTKLLSHLYIIINKV